MSHTIELSDEQYAAIMRAVAARPGASLESLVAEWAEAIDPREPDHYYTDEQFLRVLGADDAEIEAFNQVREPRYFDDVDEWFRHLGATEEVIAEGERIFQERQAQDDSAQASRNRLREPRYYETDAWLRHLGVSDEEIEASNQRVMRQLASEDASD